MPRWPTQATPFLAISPGAATNPGSTTELVLKLPETRISRQQS
jgi:hypothetical protein